MIDIAQAAEIIERDQQAAIDCYALTGMPFGVNGEIGGYVTAAILGLELAEVLSERWAT